MNLQEQKTGEQSLLSEFQKEQRGQDKMCPPRDAKKSHTQVAFNSKPLQVIQESQLPPAPPYS